MRRFPNTTTERFIASLTDGGTLDQNIEYIYLHYKSYRTRNIYLSLFDTLPVHMYRTNLRLIKITPGNPLSVWGCYFVCYPISRAYSSVVRAEVYASTFVIFVVRFNLVNGNFS